MLVVVYRARVSRANTYVDTISSNKKISLVLGSILEDDLSGFCILGARMLELGSQQGWS